MMCECREPPRTCTVVQKQTHTHRNVPDTRERKLNHKMCCFHVCHRIVDKTNPGKNRFKGMTNSTILVLEKQNPEAEI